MKKIKSILIFTASVFLTSFVYFILIYQNRPDDHERETFLSEIGEIFGTLGIWALVIIYGRTLLKLAVGKGASLNDSSQKSMTYQRSQYSKHFLMF